MKPLFTALLLAASFTTAGCQTGERLRPDAQPVEAASYISLDELAKVMASEDDVTLVEFCVPAGCVRCDQMRGPIDGLASHRREGLTIHRVVLRKHPQLAWEFELTACPSYVAFWEGEEVFRASYPTSADLIASGLEEALRTASVDQLSLAAQ